MVALKLGALFRGSGLGGANVNAFRSWPETSKEGQKECKVPRGTQIAKEKGRGRSRSYCRSCERAKASLLSSQTNTAVGGATRCSTRRRQAAPAPQAEWRRPTSSLHARVPPRNERTPTSRRRPFTCTPNHTTSHTTQRHYQSPCLSHVRSHIQTYTNIRTNTVNLL